MSMRGTEEMPYWVDATGAGWLTLPIMFHSSRESMCEMTPEQCAFKSQYWLNWYESDHRYGLATIAFLLAITVFFAIGAFAHFIVPKSVQRWSIYSRTAALARFLAYRRFRMPSLGWYSPSLGIILVGLVGFVFFMTMTLSVRPYYWPNTEEINYGDSPPIATRAGWMSLACLPFVLVLAAKENPISLLTRVAYEKLNVLHRWLSWAMYALALVHTFPFIVYQLKAGTMGMSWGMSAFYWSGVVALIAQSWLMFMSLGPIRNRFYEIFKATHLLAAALFFVFLFIHCGFTLSSVDYLIAAAVLYFLCWGSAVLRTFFEHGRRSAQLELLPHGVLKITVLTTSPWKPGQHVFLRFLSWDVHSLTAHPFTISSLTKRDGLTSAEDMYEMAFYIHPRGGYTNRLAAFARQHQTISVSLDGPYGGMKDRSLAEFDKAVVISGGAGAGFVLPVVEDVLRRKVAGDTLDINIIFSTRNREHAAWFKEQIAALLRQYRHAGLKIKVHVTSSNNAAPVVYHDKDDTQDGESADLGKTANDEERRVGSDSEAEIPSTFPTIPGRPDTRAIVDQAISAPRGTVGIAVCGPENMLFDVRNAVAGAQRSVGGSGPAEVYLYSEHFGW